MALGQDIQNPVQWGPCIHSVNKYRVCSPHSKSQFISLIHEAWQIVITKSLLLPINKIYTAYQPWIFLIKLDSAKYMSQIFLNLCTEMSTYYLRIFHLLSTSFSSTRQQFHRFWRSYPNLDTKICKKTRMRVHKNCKKTNFCSVAYTVTMEPPTHLHEVQASKI